MVTRATFTNFGEAEYGAKLCAGMKEVGIHLRSLLRTRRIKATKILNPWVLMGLAGPPPGHRLHQNGGKVLEEVNVNSIVNPCRMVSPSAAREPVRQKARESWTEEIPTVANRTGKWSHGGGPRGAHLGK